MYFDPNRLKVSMQLMYDQSILTQIICYGNSIEVGAIRNNTQYTNKTLEMETKHLECKFVFESISAWIRGALILIYMWNSEHLYLKYFHYSISVFFLLSLRAKIMYTISCNTTSKCMDSHRSRKKVFENVGRNVLIQNVSLPGQYFQ